MNPSIPTISLVILTTIMTSVTAEPIQATLYKNPDCSCCEDYAIYLRENGFSVNVKQSDDVAEIGSKAGVPKDRKGCHTSFIDGYVIDGHVPANVIHKLLADKPAINGIALPGMPMGSPGMAGQKTEKFTIYAIMKNGKTSTVYALE